MKKVYIFIIILLVLLVGSLTFYKFVYLKDKPVNNVDKNVEMVRKNVKKDEKDEVTYQSDIINDNVLSSSYKIDTITGSIYIDTKDKKLYISEAKSAALYPIEGVENPIGMIIVLHKQPKKYNLGFYNTNISP